MTEPQQQTTTAIAPAPGPPAASAGAVSPFVGDIDIMAEVQRIKREQKAIDMLIEECFEDGVHYGVIPGTGGKPGGEKPRKVLLQAGAEMACHLFHFRPEMQIVAEIRTEKIIAYRVLVRIIHIATGAIVGEATGSANTREKKYVNQTVAKVCPSCQKPSIIKSRLANRPGWWCAPSKGGCGQNYVEGDTAIEDQEGTQVADAIWDLDNTVLKIAFKRGMVSAVRACCGMSGRFEVDTEDDSPGDDEPRGGRGGSSSSNSKRSQPAQQRQETAGGEQAASQGQPAGAAAPKPVADSWEALKDAANKANLTQRDLYRVMKDTIGHDGPSKMTQPEFEKVMAKLKELQEQNGAPA